MKQVILTYTLQVAFSVSPDDLDGRENDSPATVESLRAYLEDALMVDVDTEGEGQPEGAVFASTGATFLSASNQQGIPLR
jgi:hypothetical protein